MHNKKRFQMVIPTILPALLAFFAIACLFTAFNLEMEDARNILLFYLLLSLLCGCAQHYRFGIPIFLLVIFALGYFQWDALLLSIEKLLFNITSRFDIYFNCGYIRWSDANLIPVSLFPVAQLLGFFLIFPASLTMHQRGWAVVALIPNLVALAFCCILENATPNPIFLLLFVITGLILCMTQLKRRSSALQADQLTALLLIPVMLFSYVSMVHALEDPGKEDAQQLINWFTELFSEEEMPGGSSAPIADTIIDLSSIGPIVWENTEALRVNAKHTGILYLRGRSYDTYTGTTWTTATNSPDAGGWPKGGMIPRGDITIHAPKQSFRYTPYYLQLEEWTQKLIGGAYDNPNRKTTYSFPWMQPDSVLPPVITPLSNEGQQKNTVLPLSTRLAVSGIVNTLLENAPRDVQSRANILADYVRNSAQYDLNTETMPEDATDFAVWFLENSDTGYCVHFASATAVLLRTAGIPARYVVGYITYTIPGVDVPVYDRQSHAWVEYYHPQLGWTVLDATPDAESIPDIPTAPTEQTTLPTEETTRPSEETAPPRETIAPTQPPSLSRPQNTAPTEPVNPTPERTNWFASIFRTLLFFALVFLQYGLRLRLRHRWLNATNPKRSAIRRWRYARFLARITRQKLPGELTFLAERATFSQHTLQPEQLRKFDTWCQKTTNQLLKKPLPIRWLLKLLLAV